MTPTSLDPLPDAHRTSANSSNSKFLEWRALTAHYTKAAVLQRLESNENKQQHGAGRHPVPQDPDTKSI